MRATTDLTPEGALFLQIAEEEAEELEALRQKEKEKNGENAKPAPSANVAAKKRTTRKDGALDASAKRLSKYERR